MRRPLVALALLALLGLGLARVVEVRTDAAGFLPEAGTPEAVVLLDELRGGAAATLWLAALEGTGEAELARLSRALAAGMRASGRFSLVAEGPAALSEGEREFLFRYRYLLAELPPGAFEAAALRPRLEGVVEALRSVAAPVVGAYALADPVGAFSALLEARAGASGPETREGVWFVPGAGPPRALLVARVSAGGLDSEGQAAAISAARAAFEAAAPPAGARMRLSGPGVFAAEAAAAVRDDVRFVTLLSGPLLALFLLWRLRSAAAALAAAAPLLAGAAAGTLAAWAGFGAVQAAALGFGATMLGVAADYPLLVLAGRRPGEGVAASARRAGPTLALAAGAGALGLSAMLASGFPGLAQLGLFGAAGLAAAAAASRWLLPVLLPEAPAPRPWPAVVERALGGPARRAGLLLLPVAGLWLLLAGPPRWEDDLARLSPVPEAQLRLDAELRRALGAPEVGQVVALHGPDAEAVLRASERLETALREARAEGGWDLPSRHLPSAATQAARAAALPGEAALRAALAKAARGLPLRTAALEPFVSAVSESRALPPLAPSDLSAAPLLAARLSPLLSERAGGWVGLALPSGPRDPAASRAAAAAVPGALVLDAKAEAQRMVDAATGRALLWCALGGVGVLALLALAMGGAGPALRAAAPVAGAVLVALAALSALGERLTPFHLAALLLVVGVGLDYALFLARGGAEGPGAVLGCAATTLLTFGLLALCATPVLRSIGLTVSAGVAAALLLALALSPARRGAGSWRRRDPSPSRPRTPDAPP